LYEYETADSKLAAAVKKMVRIVVPETMENLFCWQNQRCGKRFQTEQARTLSRGTTVVQRTYGLALSHMQWHLGSGNQNIWWTGCSNSSLKNNIMMCPIEQEARDDAFVPLILK
jgi:hypothetical protein